KQFAARERDVRHGRPSWRVGGAGRGTVYPRRFVGSLPPARAVDTPPPPGHTERVDPTRLRPRRPMPRLLHPLVLVLVLVATAAGRADPPADHWAWKKPARPPVPSVTGKQPAN